MDKRAKRNQLWVVEKLNSYDLVWEAVRGIANKGLAKKLRKEMELVGWTKDNTRVVLYERKEERE